MSCPPPVITSMETWQSWDEDWYPRGPRTFLARARAQGWDARMGFSRGSVEGAKQDTWEIRDMIGVWVNGYGYRAGAFWERNPEAEFSARKLDAGVTPGEIPSGMQWKNSGTMIMQGKGRSFPYANITQFTAWIDLHGEVPPTWYADLRYMVLAARERAVVSQKQKAEAERQAREQAARRDARDE